MVSPSSHDYVETVKNRISDFENRLTDALKHSGDEKTTFSLLQSILDDIKQENQSLTEKGLFQEFYTNPLNKEQVTIINKMTEVINSHQLFSKLEKKANEPLSDTPRSVLTRIDWKSETAPVEDRAQSTTSQSFEDILKQTRECLNDYDEICRKLRLSGSTEEANEIQKQLDKLIEKMRIPFESKNGLQLAK